MDILISFGIIAVLLLVGFVFGTLAEKKHYKSIILEEQRLNKIPAMSCRLPPENQRYEQALVTGSIVVANDYFKYFTAGLKNFFGGQLNTFESLLDRGRREAIIRMKKQAEAMNAELIFNVKYITTNLSAGENNKIGSIELFAYGTAMVKAKG
jgi:uncharacterized protein YbjQ (UPF0145 family)